MAALAPLDAATQRCSRERVFRKLQQTYRKTPMSICDFNKVALQLYYNPTLAWVFSCNFAAYFQKTFSQEHLWVAVSVLYLFLEILNVFCFCRNRKVSSNFSSNNQSCENVFLNYFLAWLKYGVRLNEMYPVSVFFLFPSFDSIFLCCIIFFQKSYLSR